MFFVYDRFVLKLVTRYKICYTNYCYLLTITPVYKVYLDQPHSKDINSKCYSLRECFCTLGEMGQVVSDVSDGR